jgi:hypothetical protein
VHWSDLVEIKKAGAKSPALERTVSSPRTTVVQAELKPNFEGLEMRDKSQMSIGLWNLQLVVIVNRRSRAIDPRLARFNRANGRLIQKKLDMLQA